MNLIKFVSILGLGAFLAAGCQSSKSSATTAGVKPYPSKKCIVSDEKLGGMGEPIVKVYNGQEVKFCCKDCVKEFEKEIREEKEELNIEKKELAEEDHELRIEKEGVREEKEEIKSKALGLISDS